ncbi:MAG TPA: efflux RND transporter periplasmic adaptor subunit [Phycisphaerae bacterium]|nr:efflux RND transporter periplasmic adaptor subunit [Phycisphaerae bacterium]
MKGKKKLILLIPVVVIAGVLTYRYVKQRIGHDPNVIRVSGNMEVTDVELSFRIPGWVERRTVSEGQLVQGGQEVAALDRTELTQEVELRKREIAAARAALAEVEAGSRPEEIAEAEAFVAQAKARVAELEAGSRPQEVAAAKAAVARATADTDYRKTELARMEQLHKSGAATNQELDTSRTAYVVADARLREAQEQLKLVEEGPRAEQIEQAKAALAQAQQRLALVKKGPRQEVVDQARARLQQAEQALAIAQTRLTYTTLTSPVSGLVLSENVEAGEYVAAGTPIVTVADLNNIWLRAYINETDLGRVKVGQAVRVTTDTYPGKVYEGRISFIASEAEFTPKNVQTPKERVKLVYRVKITVANPNMELKPGMPADAEIFLNP